MLKNQTHYSHFCHLQLKLHLTRNHNSLFKKAKQKSCENISEQRQKKDVQYGLIWLGMLAKIYHIY